jgi:hypothetical protein
VLYNEGVSWSSDTALGVEELNVEHGAILEWYRQEKIEAFGVSPCLP